MNTQAKPAPTPEQIDAFAFELHTMGVQVPPRDTAFFHAAVRKWLASWNDRDALVAENKLLTTELHVVAEAIWQNVNRAEMTHWARGIRISIQADGPPKVADTIRDALVAKLEQIEDASRSVRHVVALQSIGEWARAAIKAAKGEA